VRREAIIAATFIIAAFIVTTILVEVASAQQPIASSKKITVAASLNPSVIYRPYRPIYRPIYHRPIYYPPVYHRPIVIV